MTQPLFAMIGVSPMELAVVAIVILLLFGNRLPALMRSMGRSVVEFKKGVNDKGEDQDVVEEKQKNETKGVG